jgi:hypothetical protein
MVANADRAYSKTQIDYIGTPISSVHDALDPIVVVPFAIRSENFADHEIDSVSHTSNTFKKVKIESQLYKVSAQESYQRNCSWLRLQFLQHEFLKRKCSASIFYHRITVLP